MKKCIYLFWVCFTCIIMSCSKDNASSIIGTWNVERVDFVMDGTTVVDSYLRKDETKHEHGYIYYSENDKYMCMSELSLFLPYEFKSGGVVTKLFNVSGEYELVKVDGATRVYIDGELTDLWYENGNLTRRSKIRYMNGFEGEKGRFGFDGAVHTICEYHVYKKL